MSSIKPTQGGPTTYSRFNVVDISPYADPTILLGTTFLSHQCTKYEIEGHTTET